MRKFKENNFESTEVKIILKIKKIPKIENNKHKISLYPLYDNIVNLMNSLYKYSVM